MPAIPAINTDEILAGLKPNPATFRIAAEGALSNARIAKSSGNAAFDAAILAAFARARMPEKPDRRAEELQLSFRTKEIGGR